MSKLGWGSVLGKIFSWFQSRKESKENELERLLRETEQLQGKSNFEDSDARILRRNIDRIKQLRSEISKIE